MRYLLIVFWMLFWPLPSALAQLSVGIGLPGVSIGINVPVYPELVRVPGYPVYYAPRLRANFFFYDGMYWVYQRDHWYVSSWYDGPWGLVAPEFVPLFVLRIPVRYYRNPPLYFRGWRPDAAPRWGEHWGPEWQQRRSGWDRWDRYSAPAPAPLPLYQRRYSGDRYPQLEQQRTLQGQNYRYQPRDALVRPQDQARSSAPSAPGPSPRGTQRGSTGQRALPPQHAGPEVQRLAPSPIAPRPGGPAVQDHKRQPAPEREKDRAKAEERGQERNK